MSLRSALQAYILPFISVVHCITLIVLSSTVLITQSSHLHRGFPRGRFLVGFFSITFLIINLFPLYACSALFVILTKIFFLEKDPEVVDCVSSTTARFAHPYTVQKLFLDHSIPKCLTSFFLFSQKSMLSSRRTLPSISMSCTFELLNFKLYLLILTVSPNHYSSFNRFF